MNEGVPSRRLGAQSPALAFGRDSSNHFAQEFPFIRVNRPKPFNQLERVQTLLALFDLGNICSGLAKLFGHVTLCEPRVMPQCNEPLDHPSVSRIGQ